MANDAKTQGLPEKIAERLDKNGYLCVPREYTENYIRLELLGSELVQAVEFALEHGCTCMSAADDTWHSTRCHVPRLRAALNALKEGKNG